MDVTTRLALLWWGRISKRTVSPPATRPQSCVPGLREYGFLKVRISNTCPTTLTGPDASSFGRIGRSRCRINALRLYGPGEFALCSIKAF